MLPIKTDLIKRLRNGDTIREYFMGDMKISFTDFTDIIVPNSDIKEPVAFISPKRKKTIKRIRTTNLQKK